MLQCYIEKKEYVKGVHWLEKARQTPSKNKAVSREAELAFDFRDKLVLKS